MENDTFKMFCPRCGQEWIVDAFDQNPVCECGAGLDFVPHETPKEETK